MKIVFMTTQLACGGAERQLALLAQGLRKIGYFVSIVALRPGGQLEEELRKTEIEVESINIRRKWYSLNMYIHLIKCLRKHKPDILHSYMVTANVIAGLLKVFFPKVRFVWGVRASKPDLRDYHWYSRLNRTIERWLSKCPNLIIANSYAGRDYSVECGFPSSRISVIHNGIDTEYFCPDCEAREKMREKLGVKDDEYLITLVGRLDCKKDHISFLEAAALSLEKRDNLRYLCIGNGSVDYLEYLKGFVEKLGLKNRMIWLPSQKNVVDIYNASDIISVSSRYGEGFPNVLAEAMACGRPCVVTDVGDSRLIADGIWNVVPPQNPTALSKAWDCLLNEPVEKQKKRGQHARNRVVNEYSVEKLVRQTDKALKNLIGRDNEYAKY